MKVDHHFISCVSTRQFVWPRRVHHERSSCQTRRGLRKLKETRCSVQMPVSGTRVATWRNALLVSSEQRLVVPVRYENELASDQTFITCIYLTNILSVEKNYTLPVPSHIGQIQRPSPPHAGQFSGWVSSSPYSNGQSITPVPSHSGQISSSFNSS